MLLRSSDPSDPRWGSPLPRASRDDLLLQAVQWTCQDVIAADVDPDVDENDRSRRLLIKCYGADGAGRSATLNVLDFQPFVYVRLDPPLPAGVAMPTDLLRDRVAELLPSYLQAEVASVHAVRRFEYWGFTNREPRAFAQVFVTSARAFHKLASALESSPKVRLGAFGSAALRPYETRLAPDLRFLHARELNPSGWVRVARGAWSWTEVDPVPTTCQLAYEARWDAVHRPDSDDRPLPMAPVLIASFDIECTSGDGQFPLAKKDFARTAKDIVKAVCGAPGAAADPEAVADRLRSCILSAVGVATDGEIAPLRFKRPAPEEAALREMTETVLEDALAAVAAPASNAFQAGAHRFAADPKAAAARLASILNERFGAVHGDPVIQIGMTAHRYGSRECEYKAVFVLGTCDPLPGVHVVSVDTEAELLRAWSRALVDLDPDLVTGYNLFGFDCRYVFDRASELGILADVKISRLRDAPPLSTSSIGGPDSPDVTLDAHGRVVFDLMRVVRSGGTAKLSSFKLDVVACHHISGRVRARSADGCRLELDDGIGLAPGAFVRLRRAGDGAWTPKLEIDAVHGNEVRLVAGTPLDGDGEYAAWGLVKDDIAPAEIFACHEGSAADRARIAKYCVMDCAICNYLVMKLEVVPNTAGMAHVCGLPMSLIFLRGQGIKVFSLIMRRCAAMGFAVPNRRGVGDKTRGYEGAIVLEPEPGLYTDPVAVLDYASLYPSSIMAENISHDTIVLDDAYGAVEGVEYVEVEYQDGRRCRFAQNHRGVLPEILADLIRWRKQTRRRMELRRLRFVDGAERVGWVRGDGEVETESGERVRAEIASDEPLYNKFQLAILDALQLAYKVTSNSVYGSLGFPGFDLYLRELAASTTAVGRGMLHKAKAFAEGMGARVVYGDTDSIFVTFPRSMYPGWDAMDHEARVARTIEIARDVERQFQGHIKPPHKLEYEKVAAPLLMLGKKAYAYNKYESDPSSFSRCTMGLKTVRTDCSMFVRTALADVMDVLLNRQDVPAAADLLRARMQDLVRGRVPAADLVVSKKLNAPSSYQNPAGVAHLVLAMRMQERDPGSAPKTNDRVPYLHVHTGSRSALMGDHIESPEYAAAHGLKIDYKYYIAHQLQEPILQIFVLPGILEKIHAGGKRAPSEDAKRRDLANKILFDPVLNPAQRAITAWFAPRGAEPRGGGAPP